MNRQMVLCCDTDSLMHPETLGLADERLEGQSWLTVFSDAAQARKALSERGEHGEVWVVSSDSMEGINLAAALKRDDSRRKVSLVSFNGAGSVMGRCQAAGVGLIRSKEEFVRGYAERKRQMLGAAESPSANVSAGVSFSGADLGSASNSNIGTKGAAGQARVADGADSPVSSLPVEEPALSNLDSAPTLVDLPIPTRASFESSHPKVFPTERSKAERMAHTSLARVATDQDAYVLSVVSGSGGVGKSAIAACCAVVFQSMGKRTLLLDADLQFGDMEYLVGRDNSFDITDLIAEPERISQVEPKGNLPALIASPRRLEQSELIMGRMAELIGYVRGFFDVVVVNTGAFWSEQHAQVLEASDKTLFVLDQRPSSVRSCSHALELCERCGIATQSCLFVLNFCTRHSLLTSIDVSCALKGAHVEEVKDGGKDVGELLGAGLPEELLASRNPFSESIKQLCAGLLPGSEPDAAALQEASFSSKRGSLFGFRRRRAACL